MRVGYENIAKKVLMRQNLQLKYALAQHCALLKMLLLRYERRVLEQARAQAERRLRALGAAGGLKEVKLVKGEENDR